MPREERKARSETHRIRKEALMSQVRQRRRAAPPTRRPNTQMTRSCTRGAKADASATTPRSVRPFGFGTSRPGPPWSAPPAAA